MQAIKILRQPIQQLSRQLANQIAAGEVVERPASVVKELIENSLDAGATTIDIDIRAGGTLNIRVRDNGTGIPQNELHLALSPHATSKITSLDDLIHVLSMGFRGEALASIASVSELTLTSYHEDTAWRIKSNDGQFELSPASHPQGTTLEVSNLFYNTPARRKFLRSERTEFRYIEDVVKRIALARFDIAIHFRHNQRQIFSLAAAKSDEAQIQRLARIINKEFIQHAVALNFENAGLKLWGWLASPAYSRSQSDMQYFFVNGRMIRDKIITHAIRQAFDNKIYPGRFPVYVLHLEMNPEQVDVNVHPTKHEVRFRQTRLVHDFLVNSLQQALAADTFRDKHTNELTNELSAVVSINEFTESSAESSYANNIQPAGYTKSLKSSLSSVIAESPSAYSGPEKNSATRYESVKNKDIEKPLGVAIAKIRNDYLVAQNSEGVLLISLSRARRLILENKINTRLSEENRLISKPVLLPFSLRLKTDAAGWLKQNSNGLQQFGFEFTILGENEIMLRQVPVLMKVEDLKLSMEHFIEKLQKYNVASDTAISDVLLETILDEDFSQMPGDWNTLLRELEQGTDITGLYHQISEADLSKWFR